MNGYPKYKAKEKEALAWLFGGLIKIELNPIILSLRHTNEDFMRRFLQLVQLGRISFDEEFRDTYIKKWQLTNPKEIAFLMAQIEPHIHTQREKNIATLIIKQCTKPNTKTQDKLKPLIQKHNVYFSSSCLLL